MLEHLNLKNPVVIGIDPECADEGKDDFFAIWTNEPNAVNATLAESIGEKQIAQIICDTINYELGY